MFRKVFASAGIALVLASTPAAAADLIVDTIYDPEPIAANWTGFYVGGWLGGRVSNVNNIECVGLCADDFGIDGLTGGLTAGYDMQFDDMVVGVFATLPLIRPTTTTTLTFPGPFSVDFDVSPQWAATAGVRAGLAIDNMLPYLLAGIGVANVEVDSSLGSSSSATHVGVVLGAGLEYKIDENWSLDGRYMLGLLGEAEYDFGGGVSSYDEVSHNFSVGLNYRF